MRRYLLIVLSVVTLTASALAGWALYDRFAEGNRAVKDNKATWHAVICTIEAATVKNPKTTRAEKAQSLAFFDGLLVNNVGTKPCRLHVPRVSR